jgi:hypothetical protein
MKSRTTEMVAISSGETMSFHSVESWLNDWLANKAGGASGRTMVCRFRLAACSDKACIRKLFQDAAGSLCGCHVIHRHALLCVCRAFARVHKIYEKLMAKSLFLRREFLGEEFLSVCIQCPS